MSTAERVSYSDPSDGFVLARSVLAYRRAAEIVGGDVLEIGTGNGYGVEILAEKCRSLTTVDKYMPQNPTPAKDNVSFRRMRVPPLGFEDASFDFVVAFQVVEHIRDDHFFLSEITRVLRPGGRLVITTPNRPMSLTRNPWHVREYSAQEFGELLGRYFREVEMAGIVGNERAMEYYERNRDGVRRVLRWDVLRLSRWLPRWLLRVPYDLANRLNRRRLMGGDAITPDDYALSRDTERAFDLLCVVTK